jgi:2-C-methyl-D-erythritol 2,4-cyclodiphosphate synthase
MRIGHGYDVHKLGPNRKLILGGVQIPFMLGLIGHSDADVLVHAIIDSLLGAAALGSIGMHFPDTNPEFKNISSLVLLSKTNKKILNCNFNIINIDSTIVAQNPKLDCYVDAMRKNIAESCNIDANFVSIKATTEEKLGFTGCMEGIAAHAVCLIA